MDSLACMRAFTRVVEHGSFARAADDLGISRASLSQAIARLEARLEVRLLTRTTRRLSLTEEGRSYFESCTRILADLQEAEDALSAARSMPRGRLRISLAHGYANLVLFPALPEFFARYPDIELEAVVTDRAVDLVEEGIDCAVRATGLGDDATLAARRIADLRWITCATPSYLARQPRPHSVDDLNAHNCIGFVSPSTGRGVDWSFLIDGRRATFAPRGNLRVTSLEAAASAAAAGLGIAQVPEPLVGPAIGAGELEALLPEATASAPSVHVVYPRNRYLSAKTRAFIDFLATVEAPRAARPRAPGPVSARATNR